jgi:hypothetical protein
MTNKFFSNDELSALAYEANQMVSAGYEDEAQMIRRQPTFTAWIAATAATVVASLSAALVTHDLPAAMAYEAKQAAAAGYQFGTIQERSDLRCFNNRAEAIHSGAAAIIAWDKKLRTQNAKCSITVRSIHSFNAR